MRFWLASLATCAALIFVGHATADTSLGSGGVVPLSLPSQPPNNYVTNYYVDIDSSAQELLVSVSANGGDVDLFLRCGAPFPAMGSQPIGWDLLHRYAQYHSIGSTSNESIQILRSSKVPLFCPSNRWYIAVINSGSGIATGSLSASTSTTLPVGAINLDFANPRTDSSDHTNDCDVSFWTDPTATATIGGNTGTTLGEQRRNALTYAAQQLAQQLDMHTSITVHACAAHLGGDANSAILAHAAPLAYFTDSPSFPIAPLPTKYTWYPAAAIANLAGTSMCGFAGGGCDGLDASGTPNNEEIEITFNEDIGTSTVIGGENFYLGYQAGPTSSIDFITVAMHEMTHGLGFFGLANTDAAQGPIGAKAGINTHAGAIAYTNVDDGPYDDIFDTNVAIVNGSTYTPFMGYEVNGSGDAARAAALVSGPTITQAGTYNPGIYTGLRWFDAEAVDAGVNIHRGEAAPNDFPSLYAPCDETKTTTCATQRASTLSHTVQANDMMNAFYSRFNLRNMGLAAPMLGPIGWSTVPNAVPSFTTPMPSNWFDRTHSGHGFDFQLAEHDAVHGDVYFLTFYTYAADGTPEWYQTSGRLIDGVFVSATPGDAKDGHPDLPYPGTVGDETLLRYIYDSSVQGSIAFHPDSACTGGGSQAPCSVTIDFNQGANSPVCRNVDRSNAGQVGVMTWSIGTDSASWCMEPIVPLAAHAQPDYNGHWFASSDGGWGFELLDVNLPGASGPTVIVYVYYPGPNGQPTWATASGTYTGGAVMMDLQQVTNGFCRSCTPPAGGLHASSIGSFTLSLSPIVAGQHPTGMASIQANYPGGGGFSRTSIPVSMLSIPTGQ